MAKKLVRGVDWHGWAWFWDNDEWHGTGLDSGELFDKRVTWAHRRRGRFVRVKLVPVDPVTPRKRRAEDR